MADRRIAYLVLLAVGVILFLFYEAFLSWYLLLAVLLCPVLSLAISLPAMRQAAVKVSAPETVIKGQACEVSVKALERSRLPFGRLSFTFDVTDAVGQFAARPRTYSVAGYGGACLRTAIPTDHCGILTTTVYDCRVTDLLGLFLRRPKNGGPVQTLVLPVPLEPAALPPLPEDGQLVVRPGGGLAEDYELRSYQPGDAVRSIHWKLSTKTDDLIVRDALVPQDAMCHIALAYGGSQDAIDRTLSHLSWVSVWLLERQQPHCYYWYDYQQQTRQQLISCQADLDGLIRTLLLSIPAESPEYPLVDRAFFLDAEEAAT